uniref:uncharacterized protein LOC114588261 n=1 Tax=Podarcis muralis TaxID=64176 RepID=UPI00109FC418|nr:uncharacterized protein LOC114588261 [Podarcis muralis]
MAAGKLRLCHRLPFPPPALANSALKTLRKMERLEERARNGETRAGDRRRKRAQRRIGLEIGAEKEGGWLRMQRGWPPTFWVFLFLFGATWRGWSAASQVWVCAADIEAGGFFLRREEEAAATATSDGALHAGGGRKRRRSRPASLGPRCQRALVVGPGVRGRRMTAARDSQLPGALRGPGVLTTRVCLLRLLGKKGGRNAPPPHL